MMPPLLTGCRSIGSGAVHPLPHLFLLMFPAYALKIALGRQRPIFGFREETFRGSMQQSKLLAKTRGARFRQRLNQVFQHGTQPPRNLYALAAELADFGDSQVNKVLPVGSPVDKSKAASGISYDSRIEVPITPPAK